jgi:tRNA (guanine10-N2)-methyltransferase
VTIRKMTSYAYPPPTFKQGAEDIVDPEMVLHIPAHKDFREKYFQSFLKKE